MTIVSNQEMYNVKGGAVRWGIYAGIGAFASFIIGFVDGFVNLKKCNK